VARTVIDPLTRIEGHLRVECEVEDGVVTDAWITGGLYRGMETILQGRAPADAFYIAQRICGVCPISHGHASTMAAESALGINLPKGAQLVRNIIEGAQYLHSHILWFYTLAALDYVDPLKAAGANIGSTYELAQAAGTSSTDFKAVQDKLTKLVEGGQLSIFTNGWFGHPAYSKDMPAELDLIGVAHYLEALEMQADAARIIAIMGGKFPHFMTSLPGGTAWMPTDQKLDDVLARAQRLRDWVYATMLPDTLAIAPFYKEALTYGAGTGNLLSWGVFYGKDSMELNDRYMPNGMITGGQLQVSDADPENITEYVQHSWYKESDGGKKPADGTTNAEFTELNTAEKYSWVKAPRYDGKSIEVGPLARMVVAYLRGREEVVGIVDSALKALGAEGKPEVLVSLLGRVAARNLETAVVADWMLEWISELAEAAKGGDVSFFEASTATEGDGLGLWEAPRGALGHWMSVKGGKIDHYQVVTPSTWDMSSRDDDGVRGAGEEALIGTPILDVERPLEACRIVRSFDP